MKSSFKVVVTNEIISVIIRKVSNVINEEKDSTCEFIRIYCKDK